MANPWDNDPVVGSDPFGAALAAEGVSGKVAEIARSIYQQESSSGKNTKTSNAGAVGGMQVIPATFSTVADRGWDIKDPVHNARAGIRYVAQMFEKAGGDPQLTAAGYYGGPGGLEKARRGVAVSDPRNPKAPNTLQYGQQVAARMNPIMRAGQAVTDAIIPSANAGQGNPWDNDPVVEGPTQDQKRLASVPMRLAKGGKDPIDGLAQLVQRILPDKDVNAINSLADKIGGPGTFLGDVLGIKGMSREELSGDIRSSNAEYESARKATGQTGFDGARFIGNVLSPANFAAGRVAPVAKAGSTLMQVAAKGAAGGVIGAASQPVMSSDFWTEKLTQAGMGAAFGSVLAPALSKAATGIARMVGAGKVSRTPQAIEYEIKASLARDDIDVGQIPKALMARLTAEVQEGLASGQVVDAPATLRKMDFEKVGVKPLLGQVTRDPTQFTRELNLRGVQGVGEPIANRLNEQASTISSRFRQASAGAQNPYEAGQGLVGQLRSKDKEMAAGVRAGYKAFKDSTGKELDVPLEGLTKGYQATLAEFDDLIPTAVRNKFNALSSPEGGKLSIEGAERLIKTLNSHYNPTNKPQALALDELRRHVQGAILEVTDTGSGMEAAGLANMARDTARQRFSAIDSAPALKAAINSAEPDDFVRKYVINGKVREINELAKLVGPEGQRTMKQQMLKHLEGKAFGANAAGDGPISQASFNAELKAIGRNKLEALLGPEQADDLFTVGRVMAYIQQQPAGSAVNNSNTGAMVASLLGKIGGTIKGAPYINDLVIKPIGAFKDRAAVKNALAAQLPAEAAKLDPKTINALARLMGPVPVATGAALGYSVR